MTDHFTRYFLARLGTRRGAQPSTTSSLCVPFPPYSSGSSIWPFDKDSVSVECARTFNRGHGIRCGVTDHRWGSRVSPSIQQEDYGTLAASAARSIVQKLKLYRAIFDETKPQVREPIVQCVQVKPLPPQPNHPERYRAVFSDIANYVQTMLATRKATYI